ncbi:MAG: AraC family ligand binding domain-containing protein [Dehalococcoidales bacterium]|jgi:mannose-6-phosphate isomerase-like protein (cupin superfamily)|nr:AraC family ligand binding domain-containing protein [Dehalococcoidales bacterium]MDP7416180.1 AraC family ligand binding domain-containing protein [Dehalococcoidales bacterium]
MKRKEPYATPEEFDQRVIHYRDIPSVELVPDIKAHILSSGRMTAIFTVMPPNSAVPRHQHEHEQIMIITEGECDQIIDDRLYHLKEGNVVICAPNQPHGTYVSNKGCRTIEFFAPRRQEYMDRLEAAKKNLGK